MSEQKHIVRIISSSDHCPVETISGAFCSCSYLPEISATNAASEFPAIFETVLPRNIQFASLKRRAEYVAGRFCAVRAISKIYGTILHIPTGTFGQPIWPEGLIGSIAHTMDSAVAFVCRQSEAANIGIDIEKVIPEQNLREIISVVLTEREAKLSQDIVSVSELTTILFSAKEAAYKAIHPFAKRFISFHELECVEFLKERIVLRLGSGLRKEVNGRSTIDVHYAVHCSEVLTICHV